MYSKCFQQKIQGMQRNKKLWPTDRKKKKKKICPYGSTDIAVTIQIL